MLWVTRDWPAPTRFAYSFIVSGVQHNVVGTTIVTAGTIYHVAVTIDYSGGNTKVQLFVNGAQEANLTTPGTPDDDTLWQVGLEAGGGVGNFPGTIDEIAFYESALSAAQIAYHYTWGTDPPALP